ncbi:aminotransferase class III-fold pyridoxal phosphate-dependent enzyme [Woeseiaceae bacterium]|jgi:acetylornithine/N-succinyldiaminopimelate aminotransferase|nr:aminotransferase class III-fold pyridoxal phosphate-dependent enzyme [Woeseiaceae bacterium]
MSNQSKKNSDIDFFKKEEKVMLGVYKQLSLSVISAKGCELITNDNRKILDLYGGHAVMPLGYGEVNFLDSVKTQMTKLLFQSNLLPLEIRARAAENLLAIAPDGLAKVFFVNSGSEANENALKIACLATGRKKILAVTHGFHGRTAASAAVTWGAKNNWYGFPTMPFEVEFIPRDDLSAVNNMINSKIAAVIIEPIQGVAGAYDLSFDFLRSIRQKCHEASVVLIVDEVQSGMGRSGNYFAIQNYDIEPDILTTAKSLGGGIPCAALITTDYLSNYLKVGDLGSTFGGGPLACSAINAVIESLSKNKLLQNVKMMEKEIRERCLVGPVKKIQGKGLLLGLVCNRPATEIQAELLHRDILTGTSADNNVLRLLPPLILQSHHIDKLSDALASI